MFPADAVAYAFRALSSHRLRSALIALASAIGVASVIVLTGLGEGARSYVLGELRSLGTHLLIVLPGRSETKGGPPPLLAETPRDLTIDDALALRQIPGVRRVAPVVLGTAPVSFASRERETTVIGSTQEIVAVRRLRFAEGGFRAPKDPRRAAPVCVLGATVCRELFGTRRALGQWVRIGERRFRVTGVLASRGRSLGLDLDEMVLIPVASAQALFDTHSLFRVLVEARSREAIPDVERGILDVIRRRHEGEDDVTVITQDALLSTFDRILRALTLAVGGIASISLAVAGVLILNVMLVAVSQRTREVGLLMALGAARRQVLALFLVESVVLAGLGAAAGVGLGWCGCAVLAALYPAIDVRPSPLAAGAAGLTALLAGALFGLAPAKRAAALDPVDALAGR